MVGSNPAKRVLLPVAQNFGSLFRLKSGLFALDVSRGKRSGIFSSDPDADRREALGHSTAGFASVLPQTGLRGRVQAVGSSPPGGPGADRPRVEQLVLCAPCSVFGNCPRPATLLRTNAKPHIHLLWFRPGWSRKL